MEKHSKWEEYFHLVEFYYNNGYQVSLKMSPFETLFNSKCNTPVSWDNRIDVAIIGPDFLREMEKQVEKIKQILKDAQDRHKSYENRSR